MTATFDHAPTAVHRGASDLPFVDIGDGTTLQLVHVDLANGVWVIRNQFQPGFTAPIHRHTGPVHAFTQRGSWYYLESPDQVNRAGSYLYEPAGSVHTLHVPADNDEITEAEFVIHGSNLNLDADGTITMAIDAHFLLPFYEALCAEQFGVHDPPVVVVR